MGILKMHIKPLDLLHHESLEALVTVRKAGAGLVLAMVTVEHMSGRVRPTNGVIPSCDNDTPLLRPAASFPWQSGQQMAAQT